MVPVKPKIAIGLTSIIGYLVALLGLLPDIIKTLETGSSFLERMNEPEEIAALVGIVAFAITQIGRYAQAIRSHE